MIEEIKYNGLDDTGSEPCARLQIGDNNVCAHVGLIELLLEMVKESKCIETLKTALSDLSQVNQKRANLGIPVQQFLDYKWSSDG